MNLTAVPSFEEYVEFYKSGFLLRKWRWRVKANNGKIIGASSQSYLKKEDCEHNAASLGLSLVRYSNAN